MTCPVKGLFWCHLFYSELIFPPVIVTSFESAV